MRCAGRLRPRLKTRVLAQKSAGSHHGSRRFLFLSQAPGCGLSFQARPGQAPDEPLSQSEDQRGTRLWNWVRNHLLLVVREIDDQRTAGRQPSKVRGDRVKDLASTQRREERCSGRAQDGYRSGITISHETSEASAIESPIRSELRLLTGMPQAYHPPYLHRRPETQLPSSRSFSPKRGIARAARLPRAGRYVRAET